MNSLARLTHLGQSFWLDEVSSPDELSPESLQQLLAMGFSGIAGYSVLSGPALKEGAGYDQSILDIAYARRTIDAGGIYEQLLLQDIAYLADELGSEYLESRQARGLVAIPMLPLPFDSADEVHECGRRLARRLNRPNTVVKIPASPHGIAAVQNLVADNVSVYVADLRDRKRIAQVHDAYLAGLEQRVASNQPIAQIHCLAGVNMAGIDDWVDMLLDEAIDQEEDPELRIELEGLKGKAAIATGRLAAAMVANRARGPKWNALQRLNGNPLTLVWERLLTTQACQAATYFDSLIGPHTICALSRTDLAELTAHIVPSVSLFHGYAQSHALFSALARAGLDLDRESDSEDAVRAEKNHLAYLGALEVISEKRIAAALNA